MKTNRYLALLRGINVGGNNLIKMLALKACFEEMGFSEVKTYIQSGNVIFQSSEKKVAKLTDEIEKILSKTFSYKSKVVVLSESDLKKIVEQAPKKFGQEPNIYRYDVIFLKPPLTAKEAIKEVKGREGVDRAYAGQHALYFSRIIAQATKSYLPKIVQLSMYQFMTIRNWNTTTKLAALMEVN